MPTQTLSGPRFSVRVTQGATSSGSSATSSAPSSGSAGPVLPAPTGVRQVGSAGTTTAQITCTPESGATSYRCIGLTSGVTYGRGTTLPLSLSSLPAGQATPVVMQAYSGSTPGRVSASVLISTGVSGFQGLGPTPAPLAQTRITWLPSVPGWTELTSGPIGALDAGTYSQVPLAVFSDPVYHAAYYALQASNFGTYGSLTAYTGSARLFFGAVLVADQMMNSGVQLGYTSGGYVTIDAGGNLVSASEGILAALDQQKRFAVSGATLSSVWAGMIYGVAGTPTAGIPAPQVLA